VRRLKTRLASHVCVCVCVHVRSSGGAALCLALNDDWPAAVTSDHPRRAVCWPVCVVDRPILCRLHLVIRLIAMHSVVDAATPHGISIAALRHTLQTAKNSICMQCRRSFDVWLRMSVLYSKWTPIRLASVA